MLGTLKMKVNKYFLYDFFHIITITKLDATCVNTVTYIYKNMITVQNA